MRNVSFSLLSVAQVLGFMFGLVLGGILISTAGWRAGFYICGGLTLCMTVVGWFTIPRRPISLSRTSLSARVYREVDWIGTGIASAGLAMLAYVLA